MRIDGKGSFPSWLSHLDVLAESVGKLETDVLALTARLNALEAPKKPPVKAKPPAEPKKAAVVKAAPPKAPKKKAPPKRKKK